MLLRYFGFSDDPFGATPDPRFLYHSAAHREALASLKYGYLNNRGFTALIAPPGMGKTTLLFRLLEDIGQAARTVFLFDLDSQCQPRELVGHILRDIGIVPAESSAEMHEQLKGVLVAEAQAGRKFVVVVDEAQNLSDAALETARLLTNFETPRAKLMQIILAGQPQLSDKLMQPSLLQLRQRISTICQIEPLSAEETLAYIEHRLEISGYRGDPLFTRDALNRITQASQGVPRVINTICFNALSLCYALKRKQIDGPMVAEVISDQQLSRRSGALRPAIVPQPAATQLYDPAPRRRAAGLTKLWAPAAAILLLVSGLGALRSSELRSYRSHTTVEKRLSEAKVVPPSMTALPAPATDGSSVKEPARSSTPIEITVEPDQTLEGIARQYLRSPNAQRLEQIQELNPKLVDPNHIEAGQKIWIPQPPVAPLAENEMPQQTRGSSHEP